MLIPIDHKIHSFFVVYFNYFTRNSAKSTTPVLNRKLIPTRRNEKSSSTWWGGDNVLRRIDSLIQYGVPRRVDSEFLSEFRRNKAVKFNSGQYMNYTSEGGPWAPILVGGYFTGAARSWEYTVINIKKFILWFTVELTSLLKTLALMSNLFCLI